MMTFQYPSLFLLAIPMWFAFRQWGKVSGVTGWLRLVTMVVLLIALTGPELNVGGRGIDVIIVADRSRSMPRDSHQKISDLIKDLDENRGPGDRVGIVTFGSEAQIERILKRKELFETYAKEILPDGSDLNAAITSAINLVDPNRPARILVFSDGEANGSSPLSAARRAREEGIPIDFRNFERIRIGDIAVESILLPETVSPREPFQFSVWVYADKDSFGKISVSRDGILLTAREQEFHSGMNRLQFRDIIESGGFFSYAVKLEVDGDPLPENNTGAGIVRVDSGPRMLVLTSDGVQGNLVQTLKSARIPVDVAKTSDHPLTQDSLDSYRAVIIENVPASDLGRLKMERLAQFVEDLGGGLMLTGGERSFGTGGYFKSPLDEILPVSMEMREEHRKNRLALAIALDRSGSMGMPVSGGKTKMDLANLGTAECIRLLSADDMVAVIAVDSSPHVIQKMTAVSNPEPIAKKALKVESMGGGIFVYEALVSAGKELMKASEYSTRHIILFSDAQDSEEPGAYKSLLSKFAASDITVSVIGLGTDRDVDSALLKDIAKLGKGNIMFTMDPKELPRLFTQDTMSVARSTFVKKDPKTQAAGIAGQLLPDARLMGNLGSGVFPNVDGYNLSYLKPDATGAVVSQDEYQAPWSAFWYRGLGRVAAIPIEVDGKYSGAFSQWENYDDFLITHGRWLLGGNNPDEIFSTIEREGQDAVVTVELDPERDEQSKQQAPQLVVVPPGNERMDVISPDFIWTGPNTLQARFRMDRTGTFRTLVKSGNQKFTRGPAVTLPYSPEYVPRIGLPAGQEILSAMGQLTNGKERTNVLEVLRDPPRSARTMSLLPWLFILGICLLVVEIAGRRLSLWERMAEAVTPSIPELAGPKTSTKQNRWWPNFDLKFRKRQQQSKPTVNQTAATSALESSSSPKKSAEHEKADTADKPSTKRVFDQAKKRAKRRLK